MSTTIFDPYSRRHNFRISVPNSGQDVELTEDVSSRCPFISL
ncbi:hypothetical protein COLO4_12287 [Corchorus olitorius]|uniref:Uncharacterized protein n=1 Tax=Corchorus olitorius TaxID=93759 RepID=A0A1R3K1D5_9ROSI|nr:hypothetical protein COLO4_12287 [Corchorus olitorius]